MTQIMHISRGSDNRPAIKYEYTNDEPLVQFSVQESLAEKIEALAAQKGLTPIQYLHVVVGSDAGEDWRVA